MDDLNENIDIYFGAWITTSIIGVGMLIAELFGEYIPAWYVLVIALVYHIIWKNYVRKHADQSHNQDA